MSVKLAVFALFLAVLPARGAGPGCGFSSGPTVVLDDGKQLLQFWEAEDSPVWNSGLMPDATGYWDFVRYVRARLDLSDPERYFSAQAAKTGPDADNARLMRKIGSAKLKPIACLEALLFSKQAERRPMATEPTEFLAFILRRGGSAGGRLKIWYYTVDQPGIGRAGTLIDPVAADVAAGWRPYINLHNHNFFFDQKPVEPAAPWPSASDAQLMKNLTVGAVPFEINAVTNGFSTSHLRGSELRRFKGPDGKR